MDMFAWTVGFNKLIRNKLYKIVMNKPFVQAGVALFKNIEEFFIPSNLVLGNIGSFYISAVVFGAGISLPVGFGQGLGKVLYGLYLCCLCMS